VNSRGEVEYSISPLLVFPGRDVQGRLRDEAMGQPREMAIDSEYLPQKAIPRKGASLSLSGGVCPDNPEECAG
jgi:hypothetical protein